MRKIDEVKNKTMKNIDKIKILSGRSLQIFFKNGEDIILRSIPLDYGDDSGIFISKDNYNQDK